MTGIAASHVQEVIHEDHVTERLTREYDLTDIRSMCHRLESAWPNCTSVDVESAFDLLIAITLEAKLHLECETLEFECSAETIDNDRWMIRGSASELQMLEDVIARVRGVLQCAIANEVQQELRELRWHRGGVRLDDLMMALENERSDASRSLSPRALVAIPVNGLMHMEWAKAYKRRALQESLVEVLEDIVRVDEWVSPIGSGIDVVVIGGFLFVRAPLHLIDAIDQAVIEIGSAIDSSERCIDAMRQGGPRQTHPMPPDEGPLAPGILQGMRDARAASMSAERCRVQARFGSGLELMHTSIGVGLARRLNLMRQGIDMVEVAERTRWTELASETVVVQLVSIADALDYVRTTYGVHDRWEAAEMFIEWLHDSAGGDSWRDLGGDVGTIRFTDDLLVIRQSVAVQQHVYELITSFGSESKKQ